MAHRAVQRLEHAGELTDIGPLLFQRRGIQRRHRLARRDAFIAGIGQRKLGHLAKGQILADQVFIHHLAVQRHQRFPAGNHRRRNAGVPRVAGFLGQLPERGQATKALDQFKALCGLLHADRIRETNRLDRLFQLGQFRVDIGRPVARQL